MLVAQFMALGAVALFLLDYWPIRQEGGTVDWAVAEAQTTAVTTVILFRELLPVSVYAILSFKPVHAPCHRERTQHA